MRPSTPAQAEDLELEPIRHLFIAEAEDGLLAMEEALMKLEANPEDREPLQAVFRVAHTIKGGAMMVGFDNVAEYSHLIEDALEVLRTGAVAVSTLHVTILLQTMDALRGILTAATNGRTTSIRQSDRALVARLIPGGSATQAEDGTPLHTDGVSGPLSGGSRRRTLRIGMEKLDSLLDLTGEIAVARERLAQLVAQRRGGVDPAIAMAAEVMARLTTDLQEHVTTMRMLPLGPLFRQYQRTVRDSSTLSGKIARLEVEGEEVEVDASVVEHLRDPLTHMIRNAIDHGIEYPAARRDSGKDPCGSIIIGARHEGSTVVITIRDDGAGLRRDRILARARERNLISETAIPSEREIDRLVLEPGFSTAEAVTELSGRGVGMDVVRRNVEALRGSIELESRENLGTTVTIRLPLTLAIIDGFAVRVGDESYVIPLDTVTECLDLPAGSSHDGAASGVISLRGRPLPVIRMRQLLGVEGPTPPRENVVVVEHAGRFAGLVVDRLLGESQAVVKPLGKIFQRLPGVSGSTILGSGRVALILDIPDLLERALRQNAAA